MLCFDQGEWNFLIWVAAGGIEASRIRGSPARDAEGEEEKYEQDSGGACGRVREEGDESVIQAEGEQDGTRERFEVGCQERARCEGHGGISDSLNAKFPLESRQNCGETRAGHAKALTVRVFRPELVRGLRWLVLERRPD